MTPDAMSLRRGRFFRCNLHLHFHQGVHDERLCEDEAIDRRVERGAKAVEHAERASIEHNVRRDVDALDLIERLFRVRGDLIEVDLLELVGRKIVIALEELAGDRLGLFGVLGRDETEVDEPREESIHIADEVGEGGLHHLRLEIAREDLHLPEIENAEDKLSILFIEEDVSWMRIALKDTIHENHLRIGRDDFGHHLVDVDFETFDRFGVGDFIALEKLGADDALGRVIVDDGRNDDAFDVAHIGADHARVLRLLPVVEFGLERALHLFVDHAKLYFGNEDVEERDGEADDGEID